MNKVLQISIWIIVLVVTALALGFVNKKHKELVIDKPTVYIDYETENRFVDEEDVLSQIVSDTSLLTINNVDVAALEAKINGDAAIKSAQVYKTIDGNLIVDVKQRKPIARIFSKNTNYYIDENGWLMPTSKTYTSRLLVVSGELFEPYAKRYKYNYASLNDSLKHKTILDEVYQLANKIDESEFWKAQIEQVYVNKDLEFVFIPKVGNHKIVFGGIDNLEGKFEKLMTFYEKGLEETGWNEYSVINLKFKNQVVCTKLYN